MIKVHKTVFTDGSYVPSFTLRLQVIETQEDIPAAIFVHQYIPKSPVMASDACEFYNVAYYDELTSVPDYIKDRKKVSFVRKSRVDKSFPNMDDLNSFLATAEHDIQRLIQQVEYQKLSKCEIITVTDSAIIESDVSCVESSDSASSSSDISDVSDSYSESESSESATESVVLSFDGN